ncbi:glycosyl transferase family 1 [Neisseria meningitidis]|nr:glycosyl transferase family 1 [Neisseria meningitidis]MBG8739551.1 glycosyl transferase family 1 [Neisseria meningitidis]MBJ7828110.1 glycosyl transferase family 1 [Neisseria meningitidis]MCG8958749.1 glycosyl transferase family 1 [Neisseria meningitidis]PHP23292.1 glycosyl transferase family 1 [Neisseria meningitidis]
MNLRKFSIVAKAEKGFYSGLTKIRTRRRSRRQYK